MLSSFSNSLAQRAESVRSLFSGGNNAVGRAFSTDAEAAKTGYGSDVKYPIHAQCEVGPNGKPCHGKPEGDGTCTGMVYFEQMNADETKISWDLTGCGKEGEHGFHIHEKADFSNGCVSAGPHYNPFGKNHGGPEDEERHAGDMGNIIMGKDGSSKGSMVDKLIKLHGDYTVINRSVMVHEDPDDCGRGDHSEPGTNGKTSLTTGNAGARIACGEILPA